MRALLTGVALAALVLTGCSPNGPDENGQATDADVSDDAADERSGPATPDTDPATPGDTDDDGTTDDASADADADAGGDAGDTGRAEPDTVEEVQVSIDDFFFDADAVTIGVGDTMTWTHDGRITHNVTARDGSFVSDNLGAGETFTHTFTEAGEFTYVCTLHGQMVATVTVG